MGKKQDEKMKRNPESNSTESNFEITEELVRSLPKTDLHVHLDGSLRLPTLIELAKDYSIDLPSYTPEGLRELVYKDRYESLGDYLKGFGYAVAVMQSEVALERIAYEFAVDNFSYKPLF